MKSHNLDATNESLPKLIRQGKIGIVFNPVTKALGYSFDNPVDTFDVNVKITEYLLESFHQEEFQYLIL